MNTEEEKKTNEPGGVEKGYSELLDETKNHYEELIRKEKEAHLAEVGKLTKIILDGDEEAEKSKKTEAEKVPTRLELYKNYKENRDRSNLQFWKDQLALRDATIRETGKDPWVTGEFGEPVPGQQVEIKDSEIQDCKKLADTVKAIIEESDGDESKFNFLFASAVR